MLLQGFTARVIEGQEVPGGYVELRHGQQYTLRLKNANRLRCDAAVYVDGKHVGTWRLNGFDHIDLERPAHDHGRFTFYKSGTTEANQAGLEKNDELGLVKVVFTPEAERIVRPLVSSVRSNWTISPPYSTTITMDAGEAPVAYAMAATSRYDSGGTGLSGHSNQNFGSVAPLDYDYSKQTTIHLRLVTPSDDPRPLTAFSSPVPPAV